MFSRVPPKQARPPSGRTPARYSVREFLLEISSQDAEQIARGAEVLPGRSRTTQTDLGYNLTALVASLEVSAREEMIRSGSSPTTGELHSFDPVKEFRIGDADDAR